MSASSAICKDSQPTESDPVLNKAPPVFRSNNEREKPADSNKILSLRRGKSRKRTRNEMYLANALEMIQKHQEAADERFVKLEAERQKQDLQLEEKRRREERQHEAFMMQMMGNMFMQIASSLTQSQLFKPPVMVNQTHASAYHQMPQQAMYMFNNNHNHTNETDQRDEIEEEVQYTNL